MPLTDLKFSHFLATLSKSLTASAEIGLSPTCRLAKTLLCLIPLLRFLAPLSLMSLLDTLRLVKVSLNCNDDEMRETPAQPMLFEATFRRVSV